MYQMEEAVLAVIRKGTYPFVASGRSGIPVALPLIQQAGSLEPSDTVFNEMFHPVRLLDHCNAVLRISGQSAGTDEMMKQAELKGRKTYWTLKELV
jgi:hypothetical protein